MIGSRVPGVWAVSAAVALFLAVALPTGDRAAAQEAPADVLAAFLDALNAGDIDGVMELVGPGIRNTSFGCDFVFGRDCAGADEYRVLTQTAVDLNFREEVLELSVQGAIVTGYMETTSDLVAQAPGIDRLRQTNVFQIEQGLIVREWVEPDLDDAQTAAFFEWLPTFTPPAPAAAGEAGLKASDGASGLWAWLATGSVLAGAAVLRLLPRASRRRG